MGCICKIIVIVVEMWFVVFVGDLENVGMISVICS